MLSACALSPTPSAPPPFASTSAPRGVAARPPAAGPPPAPAPAPVSAPPLPECGASKEGPLEGERLEEARNKLVEGEMRARVAKVLGVDCPSPSRGLDVAIVQAVAGFQRRYGRFEDEVTGEVTPLTRRLLEMVYPEMRAPDHRCAGSTSELTLPPCLLWWPDATAEQVAFMHRVYEVARKRGAAKRAFVLAADEVDVIETGPCPGKPSEVEPDCKRTHWAQRDAAHAARDLLVAARKTFDADRKRHGQRNLLVYTGYRAATFQLLIWEYHFPRRYRATEAARKRARGGPHGTAAAHLLAQYFAVRTAPPGHSLHNRGLAIDFGCVTKDGDWIGSNGSFVKAWKKSYCFRWMKKNAGRFGFVPNPNIDEPWHWEFHGRG